MVNSNPGTQMATQNEDFAAVLQTDLFRSNVSSVAQANDCLRFMLWFNSTFCFEFYFTLFLIFCLMI